MSSPLLFIPGLLCTGELFTAQIEEFGRDFQYSIADQSSFGDISACADAILERAPQVFTPIGLSMGGYLLFELLRQAPERIDRFVIVDSSARVSAAGEAQFAEREKRMGLVDLAKTAGMAPVIEALAPSMLGRSNRDDTDLLALVQSMAEETGAERFEKQQRLILSRPSSLDDLQTFRQEALVIIGEEDVLTPMAMAEEMADGLPSAELAIIPQAGHLSPIEAPDAVNAALEDFLFTND